MRPGIKVGLYEWQEVLTQVKPECVEIWFRLDWQEKYQPLFQYLKANKIPFGLHFWATLKKGLFPNLLYLDQAIAQETYILIKQTIMIAGRWGARYINFHPESYRLSLLDLDREIINTLNQDKPFNKEKSFHQLLYFLAKIKKDGVQQGVIPFLETVPKYSMANFHDIQAGRLDPQKTEGLETERFFELAKLGYPICLDLAHTMAQPLISDRKKLTKYLFQAAKNMEENIGLIHLNTMLPPFNGTDSHCGVTEKDFSDGVIPGKEDLITLLKLFKDKDVWLIPEPPRGKAVENYLALTKLVQEV